MPVMPPSSRLTRSAHAPGAHRNDIHRQPFVDLQLQQAVDVDLYARIRILDSDVARTYMEVGTVASPS
jgi:hypothetical protein